MSDHIGQKQRAAADAVRAELAKPSPDSLLDWGGDDTFDPWALFPCLYGSYSSDFDDMAIAVLTSLNLAANDRWDEAIEMQRQETLAHQMFREMLCNAELCDYGTSPRVCFSNGPFRELLPELIERWQTHRAMHWDEAEAA